MLCEACSRMVQDLFTGPYKNQRDYEPHHQNLISFLDAAQAGCYICAPFVQYLLEVQDRENICVGSFLYRICEYETSLSFYILIPYYRNGVERWIHRTFSAAQNRGFSPQSGIDVRSRSIAISEAEAVLRIQKWMGNCLSTHENIACRKRGIDNNSYPSRLLELRHDASFRVFQTSVECPTGPYVSLSYCWGPDPTFLQLTAGNMAELESGTSISQLPLAFREAISIIQKLGFRYLWIDSLCIIQSGPGSRQDWETESARMHQVYSNGILTLSLAAAASPDESILHRASVSRTCTPPFEVQASTSNRAGEALTVISDDHFIDNLYNQPLNHRAWALQEHVLATRVVSFGLGEVFWDCAELSNACSSVPGGLLGTQVDAKNLRIFDLSQKSIPYGSDYYTLLGTWWSLLEEYTRRRLTYPQTDKLVALSAIALELSKAMDDVYIAGHFWKTLPSSLDWVLEERRVKRKKLQRNRWGGRAQPIPASKETQVDDQAYCAPSWSWASIDGPVYSWMNCWKGLPPASMEDFDEMADAVSYNYQLASKDNPTGPCLFASLSIRAYCTEIQWDDEYPVALACPELDTDQGLFNEFEFDDEWFLPPEGSKYLLAVIIGVIFSWSGLVLEVVMEGDEEQVYRRVGHFEMSAQSEKNLTSSQGSGFKSLFGAEKKLITLI